MGEIINWIKEFFSSKTHSISKKLSITILIIFVILLINDYLGISYYYFTNMKINHILKIEEAKNYCQDDSTMVVYLNEIENNSLQKKSYVAKFISLFEKSSEINDKQLTHKFGENKSDIKFTKLLKENPIRSKLWNTITSSFIPIIGIFLAISLMISSLFSKKGERLELFLASIFLLIICAGLIWFLQWLLGLIPVIWNRVYINYSVNLLINLLLASLVYKLIKK